MGRPRAWPMREIVNGILYVMRAGCPWRLLPNDLPPWGTIYRWFAAWRDDGCFERINHALVMVDRERVGRDASPTRPGSRSSAVPISSSFRKFLELLLFARQVFGEGGVIKVCDVGMDRFHQPQKALILDQLAEALAKRRNTISGRAFGNEHAAPEVEHDVDAGLTAGLDIR